MKHLSSLSVEELADGICLRAGRIAAAQAELLAWIAEFDRREGWGGVGMLSCAHWLSWRIGLSPGAAREQVRVARRLDELPALAAAFADGRASYSKVRAITRAAEPGDGVDWVALARHSSAAQLETIVRGVRRAHANEAARLDPERAAWTLRTRTRYDEHGNFTMTISGPAQFLPELQAGIDAKKTALQREREAQAADSSAQTADVPAGTPTEGRKKGEDGSADDDGAPADEADGDVPAGTPAIGNVPAGTPAAGELDLDAPAPGWPAGTTVGQVRQAMDHFAGWQRQWTEYGRDTESWRAEPPIVRPTSPPPDTVPDVPAGTPEPAGVSDAEALLALARDALAAEQQAHPASGRARRPQLTARIDPLSGWGRQADGELLPPSSLRQVMTTLPGRGGLVRLRPVTTADLHRHDLGRRSRVASPALRELLGALDGERCRFPGCTRYRKLHAHHVVFWADGGPTDLSNLVLVCSRHHTLIHAHGFALRLHPDRRLELRTADDVPVLHHPAPPWGDPAALDPGRRVFAETLPPDHCDIRLDVGYAVRVLLQQAS